MRSRQSRNQRTDGEQVPNSQETMINSAVKKIVDGTHLVRVYLSKVSGELTYPVPIDYSTFEYESAEPEYMFIESTLLCRLSYKVLLKDSDHDTVGIIEISALVHYRVTVDIDSSDDEAVGLFMQYNSAMSSWPYVREAVSSVSSKMGFRPLTLGMWRFGSDKPDGT